MKYLINELKLLYKTIFHIHKWKDTKIINFGVDNYKMDDNGKRCIYEFK